MDLIRGLGALSDGTQIADFRPLSSNTNFAPGVYADVGVVITLDTNPALYSIGMYPFGFVTSQSTLDSLVAGNVRFDGEWVSFGSMYNTGGELIDLTADGGGTMTLFLDFTSDSIASGTIDGRFSARTPEDGVLVVEDFTAAIAPVTLEGNGFRTSFSNSSIEGGVFGPNADEIAGTMIFDETLDDGSIYRGLGAFLVSEGS